MTSAAAPPGSDFHYASLYLAPAARRAVHAIEALRRELALIPQTVSDRGVVHLKLAWWRDEIAGLGQVSARHPLTRALEPLAATSPDLGRAFARLVDALDDSLGDRVPETRGDVLATIRGMHGAVFVELQRHGVMDRRVSDETLTGLACLSELAHELRELRRHRRGGTLFLARDALARHGLVADDVRHATRSDPLKGLIEGEIVWIIAALDAALDSLARRQRRRHCLVCTQARLVRAALALTLADDCRVLEQRIDLIPPHKRWIAWRTRYWG